MRERLVLTTDLHSEPAISRALWTLQDARRRTLRAAAGEFDPDWSPPGDVNTVATLLYHIAAIELDWLYAEVREQDIPDSALAWFPKDVRDAAGRLSVIENEPVEHALARLAWVRALLLETFRGMTLEEFRRVRALPPYDVTPEFVLAHLALHEAEHMGQILMLRALAGRPAGRA